MSAGGLNYDMLTTSRKVTLPSVEMWGTNMNILQDPYRSVYTRRIDKVGDTQEIIMNQDDSGDRINECINVYARGVNPMVGVSFDNYSNNSGAGALARGNVGVKLPYKPEVIRPPVIAPMDLMPLSRQPRVWTYALTNPLAKQVEQLLTCPEKKKTVIEDVLKGSVATNKRAYDGGDITSLVINPEGEKRSIRPEMLQHDRLPAADPSMPYFRGSLNDVDAVDLKSIDRNKMMYKIFSNMGRTDAKQDVWSELHGVERKRERVHTEVYTQKSKPSHGDASQGDKGGHRRVLVNNPMHTKTSAGKRGEHDAFRDIMNIIQNKAIQEDYSPVSDVLTSISKNMSFVIPDNPDINDTYIRNLLMVADVLTNTRSHRRDNADIHNVSKHAVKDNVISMSTETNAKPWWGKNSEEQGHHPTKNTVYTDTRTGPRVSSVPSDPAQADHGVLAESASTGISDNLHADAQTKPTATYRSVPIEFEHLQSGVIDYDKVQKSASSTKSNTRHSVRDAEESRNVPIRTKDRLEMSADVRPSKASYSGLNEFVPHGKWSNQTFERTTPITEAFSNHRLGEKDGDMTKQPIADRRVILTSTPTRNGINDNQLQGDRFYNYTHGTDASHTKNIGGLPSRGSFIRQGQNQPTLNRPDANPSHISQSAGMDTMRKARDHMNCL